MTPSLCTFQTTQARAAMAAPTALASILSVTANETEPSSSATFKTTTLSASTIAIKACPSAPRPNPGMQRDAFQSIIDAYCQCEWGDVSPVHIVPCDPHNCLITVLTLLIHVLIKYLFGEQVKKRVFRKIFANSEVKSANLPKDAETFAEALHLVRGPSLLSSNMRFRKRSPIKPSRQPGQFSLKRMAAAVTSVAACFDGTHCWTLEPLLRHACWLACTQQIICNGTYERGCMPRQLHACANGANQTSN